MSSAITQRIAIWTRYVMLVCMFLILGLQSGTQRSDVTDVRYYSPCSSDKPLDESKKYCIKKGRSAALKNTCIGTYNDADAANGKILFKITDQDGDGDRDELLYIQVPCVLDLYTNYDMEVCYDLECTAEGNLRGKDVRWVKVTDPDTGDPLCPSTFTFDRYTATEGGDHYYDVRMQDVDDEEYDGKLLIRCTDTCGEGDQVWRTPPVPAVSHWGILVMSLLVLIAATLALRQRYRATA